MPDFIAVDEINSQVITSESNIKNHIDLQTMSTTSRIGVSESNIKTAFNNKGVVRHIQRGSKYLTDYDGWSATLTGFTDINKMIYLLEGSVNNTDELIYVSDLTVDKIIFSGTDRKTAHYQVIEFY